jgi:hypothetical protein
MLTRSISSGNSDIPAGNDLVVQQQEHFTSEPSHQVPSTARPAPQTYPVYYRADSTIPPGIAQGQSPPPEPPPESINPPQVPPATTQITLPTGQLVRETTASHERVSHHWSWKDWLIVMLLIVILLLASRDCHCHCH